MKMLPTVILDYLHTISCPARRMCYATCKQNN